MTEHLPECLLPDFDKEAWVCICAQLRACERRCNEEWKAYVEKAGLHSMGYDSGYDAGIAAARAAVKSRCLAPCSPHATAPSPPSTH